MHAHSRAGLHVTLPAEAGNATAADARAGIVKYNIGDWAALGAADLLCELHEVGMLAAGCAAAALFSPLAAALAMRCVASGIRARRHVQPFSAAVLRL